VDLGDRLANFADMAAAIPQLDLTISVDTAVLHLAGALGRPAWGVLSARSDWRWMLDRDDSPWYPTLHLVRQSRLDDWPELFSRVAAALSRRVAERTSG
jgi:ADP-heptose:LPS heptosyltransferase